MLATVPSATLVGVRGQSVQVEVHVGQGLPTFTLVGLPETAVREARDRVRSAIQNCGLDFPAGRVVVNLAPADLVKEGARFDLAIAISILCATGQVPSERVSAFEFLGELGLFGEIRRVRGALCAALALRLENVSRQLVIPATNAVEASVHLGRRPLTARHLLRHSTLQPAKMAHACRTSRPSWLKVLVSLIFRFTNMATAALTSP